MFIYNNCSNVVPFTRAKHDRLKVIFKIMNRKYFRRLKQWFITISIIVVFEELIFHNICTGLSKSCTHIFKIIEGGDIQNAMGARKLLENDIVFKPSTHSRSTKQHRLPSCIIIGARKCGTRALLEFLELHPRIVINLSEMHFFSNDTNYIKGLEWYRDQMPVSGENQITIEKTPRYFVSRSAPARILHMNSTIKLIVILRHPTTRVISDFTQIYTQRLSRNESMKPFETMALDVKTGHVNLDYKAIQISVYHQHISRWLEYFPLSQIHVVDGDALIKNPLSEISKVETFLGLSHEISSSEFYFNNTRGFYCMRGSVTKPERCLGAGKGRKHVNISEWAKKKLNNYFRPQNEILYKVIGRRFRWR